MVTNLTLFLEGHEESCAFYDVADELKRACAAHPEPMHSGHEGYGVILEEVDELWDEIKKNPRKRDLSAMREEAVQVAAMAIRFLVEVVPRFRVDPATSTEHGKDRL